MNDTLTDGFGVSQMITSGQDTTVVDYYETDEYKEFVMHDWQQKVICPKMLQPQQRVRRIRQKQVPLFLPCTKQTRYDTRAALLW